MLDPKEKSDHTSVDFSTHVVCNPRVEQVLLSIRDGILLIRKK